MSQIFTASSPGRLDVIGGFADYSGSLVLQMPITEVTTVSVQPRNDFHCSILSELDDHESFLASFSIKELIQSRNLSYQRVRDFFSEKNLTWAAYVAGCAILLHRQNKINFTGADFKIKSQVPLGKGVSSSAALEVSTLKALALAFNLKFEGTELPLLAQKVENQIVGAPCGLMDQLTSYYGIANHLLPITCQPDTLHAPISIPQELKFIGVDSGVRHSVSSASYTDVRCAAFMGYSIIAQWLGITQSEIQIAARSGNWKNLPYEGYLCNITPQEFKNKYQGLLPDNISGQEFIKQYHLTTDSATQVSISKTYSVLSCTKHPILENARVNQFKQILEKLNQFGISTEHVTELGEFMYQAHGGYTSCGLNSDRTDEIVELAKQAKGIYGARITGGGSGGTVCLLAYGEDGLQSARKIHRTLEEKYKQKLVFFE